MSQEHLVEHRQKGRRFSRKTFLGAGAVAAGATGLAIASPAFVRFLLEKTGNSKTLAEQIDSLGSLEQIENFVLRKYGVKLANQPDPQYRVDIALLNYQGITNNGLNSPLTMEEAKVFARTVALIPAVGSLFQLAIPYKYQKDYMTPTGNYLYSFWRFDRGPNRQHYSKWPQLAIASPAQTAIEIELPEGVKMSDPLPQLDPEYTKLPPLIYISYRGKEIDEGEQIAAKTYGERLARTIAHESGHAFLDQVALAEAAGDVKKYEESLRFTLFNATTTDSDHPVLKAFAQVTGWKLVPHSQYIKQFEDGKDWVKTYEEREKNGDTVWIWDRDPAVWGDIEDRKTGLTLYIKYGPVQEAFSDYWMASILYPESLAPQESTFFQNIHNGLRQDHQEFIKQIAANPAILLKGITDASALETSPEKHDQGKLLNEHYAHPGPQTLAA